MKPSYGFWSPNQFKRKLKQYDLTPEQAADMVRAKRRTGYYWLEHGPPYMVVLVFELMERCGLTPEDVEVIGIKLTKKRN